jgi:hypothetical protein
MVGAAWAPALRENPTTSAAIETITANTTRSKESLPVNLLVVIVSFSFLSEFPEPYLECVAYFHEFSYMRKFSYVHEYVASA